MANVAAIRSAGTGTSSAWYTVGLLSLAAFIAYVDRSALNLLVEQIKRDLRLTETEMGVLIGPAFAISFALAVIPAAWLVDRWNRKLLIVFGLMLWSVTTLGAAFADGFGTLLICRSGVGVGEAVLAPVVLSMIGDLFPRPLRPAPTAIYVSAATMGGACSFLIVAALLDILNADPAWLPAVVNGIAQWRVALFCVGAVGVLLAFLLLATVKEPARGQFDAALDDAVPASSDATGRDRPAFATTSAALRFFVPFLVASNLVAMFSYISIAWFPTFLIRKFDLSESVSGYLFGSFTLIGGVAGTLAFPIVSQIIARRGRRESLLQMIVALFPLSLVFFLISVFASQLLIVLFAHAIFKGFNNGVSSSGSVVIAALGASHNRGRLAAAYTILQMAIASSLGPLSVAMFSQYVFQEDLGLSMVTALLCASPVAYVLYWIARRPYVEAVYR